MNHRLIHNPVANRGTSGDATLDDDIDVANEYAQKIIDVAIANAHAHTEVEENTTGLCLWCEEPVKDTRRWCSVDCRNEHERHNK